MTSPHRSSARRMPGDWLLAIARALLDAAVVTDVVEPTVADLRAEWLRAGPDPAARLRARSRGYLAFWSIVAMSPFAFRSWPGRRTPTVPFWQIQRSDEMTRRARIQLVIVLIAGGLAGGYAVARLRTPMYQASAVIQVVPASVPPELANMFGVQENRDFRLRSMINVVLSRARLERLILDFNLYSRERQSGIMEDVVQEMRGDLDVDTSGSGGTFVIKYTGANPMTVMRVTEKVASYFKDESVREQARVGQNGVSFLEFRIRETGDRLQRISDEAAKSNRPLPRPRQLELEVIEASYKNLLMRREDALGAVDVQRRQIGEQYVLVEAARLPEQPIGISRLTSTLLGGGFGLGLGLLIMVATWTVRLLRQRRADLARRRALT